MSDSETNSPDGANPAPIESEAATDMVSEVAGALDDLFNGHRAEEQRRLAIVQRLIEIEASALQAKRQNMLDRLCDQVAALAALLREGL